MQAGARKPKWATIVKTMPNKDNSDLAMPRYSTSSNIQSVFRWVKDQGLGAAFTALLRKLRSAWNRMGVVDISDEYVNWVCLVNAGMLDRGNLLCIDYALKNLPLEAPILEIGSYCGLSTNIIAYYKQKHGVEIPLITCDSWNFEGAERGGTIGDSNISHAEYRAFVKETFMRNVKTFSRDNLPFTVELASDEFFEAWREKREVLDVFGRLVKLGGSLSFCYIDGNHSYEFVRRDFLNCDEFLVPGGFLLFDDSEYGSIHEGVCRVVEEVMASSRYELIVRNSNCLFLKK